MTSINYNEFQAGQGVSAPALNENFSLTNNAIENLETTLNSAVTSITSTTNLKANKNGSVAEQFNVSDATEDNQAVSLQQLNASISPVGTVIWYAGSSAPDGYLLCNGSNVSRTTYSKLFEVIGVKFGAGDSSTTFTLPNLMDKFIEGSSVAGTYKSAGLPSIPNHYHSPIYYEGSSADLGDPGVLTITSGAQDNGLSTAKNSKTGGVSYSGSTGLYGLSATVQPPALTLLPCIKFE